MQPALKRRIIGWLSIVIGILVILFYLYAFIVIEYFSGPKYGIYVLHMALFLLLAIAGFFIISNKIFGIKLLWIFTGGTTIERVAIKILFPDHISWVEVVIPLLVAAVYFIVLLRVDMFEKSNFKQDNSA